jgi:hypothetical protein
MKPIPIDEFQLRRGIETIAKDAVDGVIHRRLIKAVDAAHAKWPLVIPQSNSFWNLTIDAHVIATLTCLCRIFDHEQSSLHLPRLLSLVQGNIGFFGEDNFRQRLKDNPFVNSLLEEASAPDLNQLKEDISNCSKNDPLVKKLLVYRNSAVSHKALKIGLSGATKNQREAITWQDVDTLLERATTIINRYSMLFNAEQYSTVMFGDDDFEYIFKCVQAKVEVEQKSWS